MFKKLITVLVGIMSGLSIIAFGAASNDVQQDRSGIYVSGFVGPTFRSNISGSQADGSTVKEKFQTGYNFGLAYGYKFNGFRIEGEAAYLRSVINSATINSVRYSSPSGYSDFIPVMINAYYDFDKLFPKVFPYVGVGVGVAYIKDHMKQTISSQDNTTDVSTSAFSYQGIAGLGYQINDMLRLTLDYRYLAAAKVRYDFYDGTTSTFKEGYQNNLFALGLTYQLL